MEHLFGYLLFVQNTCSTSAPLEKKNKNLKNALKGTEKFNL